MGKGRSGSWRHVSNCDVRGKSVLTVCGHDGCKDRLDLVHCHYAMGKERLKEHAVDVSIGFLVWYVAHQRRFVPRHSDRGM